ncbi:hypothetical protein HDV06_001976 [Boothiomyces sp. JEL0866]|nr:hypothetical protein HDV06_001976 [Boothiomyces sp. JEL0866]
MLAAAMPDAILDITPPEFEDEIPVFKPQYEEFKDFHAYMKQIEHYGYKSGILKIVPPKEWLERNYTSFENLKEVKISKPINQTFNCGGLPAGCQRQFNVEMRKNFSVEEWFHISESVCPPPVLLDNGKMTLASIKKKESTDQEVKSTQSSVKEETKTAMLPVLDQYGIEIPAYISTPPCRLSKEYLQSLERFYWRNVSFQTTMYGADMPGSIFTNEKDNLWNISNLESLLSTINTKIPGVNTPYLYFGLYKATFAWHVEDMDLFSINYIHFGAPKQWYVIPQEYKQKFERFASSIFCNEAKQCAEFLRHKTSVISPSVLEKNNVKVNKIVQYANEFIITFPDGYHQGYNTGFNCAESVNFALESWIPFGRKAHYCTCIDDSVSLDVNALFGSDPNEKPKPVKEKKQRRLPKKKCCLCPLGETPTFPLYETDLKGVYCHYECGFYIPETWTEIDDDSLPDSATQDIPVTQCVLEDESITAVLPHSDCIPIKEQEMCTNAKLQESQHNCADAKLQESQHNCADADLQESQHNCADAKLQESQHSCTNDSSQMLENNLESFYNESLKLEEIEIVKLKREFVTKNGRIMGTELIPKDRWRLRCSYCSYTGPADSNLGACIQCTKGKCLTAYHVTCAIKKKIFIQMEDGILETFCQKHDPVNVQEQKLIKKQHKEREYLDTLTIGKYVCAKIGGSMFGGYITAVVASHGGKEPQFAKWDCLKLKEIKVVEKRKKVPVYNDTKPRKKVKETPSIRKANGNEEGISEINCPPPEILPEQPLQISLQPLNTIM